MSADLRKARKHAARALRTLETAAESLELAINHRPTPQLREALAAARLAIAATADAARDLGAEDDA